jgi:hypothetical protein
MKLLSFEQYNILNESVKKFEQDLNETLNEDLASIVSSPVKYVKIKNNAKKYQKALVQQALNDVDLEKKKAASKAADKPTATLTAANKAKNASLKDLATGISTRMDDLATTDILKTVSTFAKTKAKVAAAETALKAADAVESKELKIKIKNLNKKAADAASTLKDYESSEKKEETPADTEAPKSDFVQGSTGEKTKVKSTETKASSDSESDTKITKDNAKVKSTETKASSDSESDTKITKDNAKVIAQKTELQNKISAQENSIDELKVEIDNAEKNVPSLKADYEKSRGTEKESAAANELSSNAQIIKDLKAKVEKGNKDLKDLRNTLNAL